MSQTCATRGFADPHLHLEEDNCNPEQEGEKTNSPELQLPPKFVISRFGELARIRFRVAMPYRAHLFSGHIILQAMVGVGVYRHPTPVFIILQFLNSYFVL